jgi:hypothetical protein
MQPAACLPFDILPGDLQGRLRSNKRLTEPSLASLSAIPRTPACPSWRNNDSPWLHEFKQVKSNSKLKPLFFTVLKGSLFCYQLPANQKVHCCYQQPANQKVHCSVTNSPQIKRFTVLLPTARKSKGSLFCYQQSANQKVHCSVTNSPQIKRFTVLLPTARKLQLYRRTLIRFTSSDFIQIRFRITHNRRRSITIESWLPWMSMFGISIFRDNQF